jgi:hypothetical protein
LNLLALYSARKLYFYHVSFQGKFTLHALPNDPIHSPL